MSDPFVPGRSPPPQGRVPGRTDIRQLLPYVAALELEVDRLRRHHRLFHQEVRGIQEDLRHFAASTGNPAPLAGVLERLAELLRDLREAPGYHPAHDQEVAIAVRPLVEQVFRWQQRLMAAADVALRLELESESLDWFPGRLLHILDNLISNALKYRDPAKSEAWVRLGMRVSEAGYEFRVSDNGVGLRSEDREQLLELFYRAAPARAAGLGVGLAVTRLLVEQSGGSLVVESGEGQGTTLVVVLPRYDLDDFLL